MIRVVIFLILGSLLGSGRCTLAQDSVPDGSLGSLYRLSSAKTYSVSPENPTGEKGKGGMATEGSRP